MITDYLIVYCTVPNEASALQISRIIVGEQLAACSNIIPGLRSIYFWKGDLCEDVEFLLMIKTHAKAYSRLEERIKELHPYEVPEILAVKVDNGLTDYLKWVKEHVQY